MAKKPSGVESLDFATRRTETAPQAQPGQPLNLDAGKIQSTGVGLRQGEIAALDGIAGELNLTRNQLLRYAVRRFLVQYLAGEIDLAAQVKAPPPPKNTLPLP